ncbi:hypothetical protein [Halarchaeum acidiphilum]|nr:hypothetical protein [Halarchaeum acidiphilum]
MTGELALDGSFDPFAVAVTDVNPVSATPDQANGPDGPVVIEG